MKRIALYILMTMITAIAFGESNAIANQSAKKQVDSKVKMSQHYTYASLIGQYYQQIESGKLSEKEKQALVEKIVKIMNQVNKNSRRKCVVVEK